MQRIHQTTTPPDPCSPFLPCTCAIAHSRNPADFRIHRSTRNQHDDDARPSSSWPCFSCPPAVGLPLDQPKSYRYSSNRLFLQCVSSFESKLRFKVLRVSWVVFADVEHLIAEAAPATAPQCSIPFQILAKVCVFLFTALTA